MTKVYDLDVDAAAIASGEKKENELSDNLIDPTKIIQSPLEGLVNAIDKSLKIDSSILIPKYEQDPFSSTPSNITIINPEDLVDSLYPNHTKKNRTPRKILSRLIKRNASSFQMARCIDPKLTEKDFQQQRTKLIEKIKNAQRSLNRNLKYYGYFISRRLDAYTLEKE